MSDAPTVLIIDDEPRSAASCARALIFSISP